MFDGNETLYLDHLVTAPSTLFPRDVAFPMMFFSTLLFPIDRSRDCSLICTKGFLKGLSFLSYYLVSYYNQFLFFHVKDVYFRFLANKPVFNSIQLWFFSQALFRILNDSISESGKKTSGRFFTRPLVFFLSLIVILTFNKFCRIPSCFGL